MIYWAVLTPAELAISRMARQWATAEDRRHAARYRESASRNASLAARALLRELLLRKTGRSDWLIRAGRHGKPAIFTTDGRRGPAISLSHSHGTVAAAMATGKAGIQGLGIDLEIRRPRKNYAEIAARAFGPGECTYVQTSGLTAFYQIWTLREAMGKATGAGLLLAADRTDRIRPQAGLCRIPTGIRPRIQARDSGWLLHSVTSGNAILAIAARGAGVNPDKVLQRITIFPDSRTHSPRTS